MHEFPIFMGGDRLVVTATDESVSFGPGAARDPVSWNQIEEISHPNPASVCLTLKDGKRLQFAFLSRTDRDTFSDLADAAPVAGGGITRVDTRSGAPNIALLTIDRVPGREILEVRGLVTSQSVMSRNFISDMGSDLKSVVGGTLKGMERAVGDAIAAARRDLAVAAQAAQADAVIGVNLAIAGIGDKAETVVLSGTAVKTGAASTHVKNLTEL